jgi:formate C-acetyltransferase
MGLDMLETTLLSVDEIPDTARVRDLRTRVRDAMEAPPTKWECPRRLPEEAMVRSVPVRKASAIALKLAHMPTDLWRGQLFAGSMTLEQPRMHAEGGFPDYLTASEHSDAEARGLGTGCFGHIVPDYPLLLSRGLSDIRAEAKRRLDSARTERLDAGGSGSGRSHRCDFFESVIVALDGVMSFAKRLSLQCGSDAREETDEIRRAELFRMAEDLEVVPAFPARTFTQALQAVWLLHMIFHSTKNGNAVGRLDQYAWPYLERDLREGRLAAEDAAELVDCFMLKFNERAKTTEDQAPDRRGPSQVTDRRRAKKRAGHRTSSQLGNSRDRIDATNHWLQNIIVSGLTPDGQDGTNLLSYLILRSFRRNKMTNPLVTVRAHDGSPDELIRYSCEVLKDGGGMPAFFNDEALVPAIEDLDISPADARDYTNDGCWEVIIPGKTDFTFQRLSLMLCVEWALNRGVTRRTGTVEGLPTGDPVAFADFDDVWKAFSAQLDAMVGKTVDRVIERRDERNIYAPVPLLSALIEGTLDSGTDLTAGGAKYRTYGMLAEGAAHAIDSLVAIKTRVFDEGSISMRELNAALDADFEGREGLRRLLETAPKYGNDDERADAIGRDVIALFCELVAKHSERHKEAMRFPCGVATFSWYIGIGEGLGASADGRGEGAPVSSNFSPALGRDMAGIPPAINSYGKMPHELLPAGGPLDLRVPRRLVGGVDGTTRMAGLVRGFIARRGSMMTITVADVEELKAAQRNPEQYRSLRVRMGGWCAYFTTLSHEQQNHQIKRQEGM